MLSTRRQSSKISPQCTKTYLLGHTYVLDCGVCLVSCGGLSTQRNALVATWNVNADTSAMSFCALALMLPSCDTLKGAADPCTHACIAFTRQPIIQQYHHVGSSEYAIAFGFMQDSALQTTAGALT